MGELEGRSPERFECEADFADPFTIREIEDPERAKPPKFCAIRGAKTKSILRIHGRSDKFRAISESMDDQINFAPFPDPFTINCLNG